MPAAAELRRKIEISDEKSLICWGVCRVLLTFSKARRDLFLGGAKARGPAPTPIVQGFLSQLSEASCNDPLPLDPLHPSWKPLDLPSGPLPPFPGPHFPLPGPPPSRSLPPFSLCFLAAVRLRLYLSFQLPLMKGPLCMVRPGTSYEGWQRAFVDFFLVVQSRSRGAPCQTGVEGLPICF